MKIVNPCWNPALHSCRVIQELFIKKRTVKSLLKCKPLTKIERAWSSSRSLGFRVERSPSVWHCEQNFTATVPGCTVLKMHCLHIAHHTGLHYHNTEHYSYCTIMTWYTRYTMVRTVNCLMILNGLTLFSIISITYTVQFYAVFSTSVLQYLQVQYL
jgi:hypothetical protein